MRWGASAGWWTMAIAALVVGCVASGDDSAASSATGAGAAGPTSGAGASGGDAGSGAGPAGPADIELPQLVDGAAFANPSVYYTIPFRVITEPAADAVEVVFGGETVTATATSDGGFVADLTIGEMADGAVALEVHAMRGEDVTTDTGEIVLRSEGAQMTDFDVVGSANTPRIHRHDGGLWLTWTDRRDGDAEAWVQQIDGAARFVGEPTALVHAEGETLAARCAFGTDTIGILYQGHGGPYTNSFKIVSTDGTEQLAPIALDGQAYGSFGGDIVFDGSAYVFVWRTNDGAGASTVRWMRVSEDGQSIVGPTVVADSGNDDPHGGFQPSSFISVRQAGGSSFVSFVREWYHPTLEMSIPKSQYAVVSEDGALTSSGFLSDEMQYTFHREARLFDVGDDLYAIWTASDLLDPSPDAPNLMFGARSDTGVFQIPGKGLMVVNAAADRDEPFVVANTEHPGVMVWTDNRSGEIDVFAAPLASDMAVGTEKVFGHSELVASTGLLNAVDVASNAVIVWRDNRHGFGILDPRPEMWLETAWY